MGIGLARSWRVRGGAVELGFLHGAQGREARDGLVGDPATVVQLQGGDGPVLPDGPGEL